MRLMRGFSSDAVSKYIVMRILIFSHAFVMTCLRHRGYRQANGCSAMCVMRSVFIPDAHLATLSF
jgi:hypothetical protein